MFKTSKWAVSTFMALLSLVLLFLVASKISALSLGSASNWAAPQTMTVKKISSQIGPQHEPYYFENLDCTLVEYRQAATSNKKTGCFIETAYGLIDTDTYTVIFNGSDEGLQISPYSDRDVLVPWKGAEGLLQMISTPTEGAYLAMYKNPVANMADKRNLLMQITGKQITSFPETMLTDASGRRLVINPQTISFSNYGSYMVAETTYGSFVRLNVATNSILAFAPSFARLGGGGSLRSQVAISDDGNYVAISNYDDQSFKVYDLSTCSSSVMETKSGYCKSYDYRPFIKTKISDISSIKHLRFINSGLISFEVISNNPNSGGIYELAPEAAITNQIDYLALGDSYTSGEGVFDYTLGTDSATNHCHLSIKSYPMLLRKDLFSVDGARSVACSGAKIDDVGSTDISYQGQVDNNYSYNNLSSNNPALLNTINTNFLPGYIAQNRFVGNYQPRIVTVSIGGNDVGFGDILESCAVPHVSAHQSSNVCFNTYEDRVEMVNLVDKTAKRWVSLFKQIKSQSPSSTVYALGYPIMVSGKGSCGLNVHLNKNEIEFINEMVVYINNTIASSASSAGVEYVDIENSLLGHRLCEADSNNIAMNGLTAGKDSGILGINFLGSESYHPNARGHELIEQAVLEQTKNFSSAIKKTAVNNKDSVLKAPKSGRTILAKKPSKITPKVAKKGKKTTIKAKGSSTGLKPKTKYKVKLGGSNGQQIGEVTTDEKGDINSEVTIPPDAGGGGTSLDIIGDGEGNEQIDISQPIYIPEDDLDSDGDGIEDAKDSCPGAVNSGIDADKDGVDDTCDSTFNPPSSNNTGQISSGGTISSNNPTSTNPQSSQNPTSSTGQLNSVNTNPQTILEATVKTIPNKVTLSSVRTTSSYKPKSQQVLGTTSPILPSKKTIKQNILQPKAERPPIVIAWWQIVLYVLIVWTVSYSFISKLQKHQTVIRFS
ncbi:MAG: SGNH/GDSL hydrolase family protein [bacterium]